MYRIVTPNPTELVVKLLGTAALIGIVLTGFLSAIALWS